MIGFLKKFKVLFSIFILFFSINSNEGSKALPYVTEERINEISKNIDFFMGEINKLQISMNLYTKNCDDEILTKRFSEMQKNLWRLYFKNPDDYNKKNVLGIYKPYFKQSDNFLTWKSRYDFPMAFSYNLICENYNASVIKTTNNIFLAFEAPSGENKHAFYDILSKQNLEYFVKLNPLSEYPEEDYFCYWENYNFKKFFEYNWPHRQKTEEKSLLEFIKSVKTNCQISSFIGVSCRAGAGRTGAFIAAYEIVNEIEKQLNSSIYIENLQLNIDKIVWNILVQRPFAVTHASQYITLYRLADFYIENFKNYLGEKF